MVDNSIYLTVAKLLEKDYIQNEYIVSEKLTKNDLKQYTIFLNNKYPWMFEDFEKFLHKISRNNKQITIDAVNFLLTTKRVNTKVYSQILGDNSGLVDVTVEKTVVRKVK